MAIIRAIASGNFSSGSIWSGSIVPSTGDEAVASGNTITISGTVTTISLRNDTAGGATAGGTFILANSSTMNTTGTTGLFVATSNATPVLQFNLPSGSSATYNGNNAFFNGNGLAGGSGGSKLILYQNTGTFYINGNFNMDVGGINIHKYSIQIAGTGRVEIVGNLTSTVTSTNNPTVPLYITAVATVIINAGNITGGAAATNTAAAIYSAAAANLDITCPTIQGGNAPAIHMLGGGSGSIVTTNVIGGGGTFPAISNITIGASISITGAVTAGTNSNGVNSLSSVTVTGPVNTPTLGTAAAISTTGAVIINGNVTNNGNANGITCTGNATVTGNVITNGNAVGLSCGGLATINGLIFNNQQFQGVFAPRILIGPATSVIRYQTFSGTTQLMWSGSSTTLGLPTPNNVRFGTSYGADNAFTGTCRIPAPEAVLVGVPVGTTVGSLVMSPAAVVAELGTSTLDVAVRLQNVATVETTGQQAATYFI